MTVEICVGTTLNLTTTATCNLVSSTGEDRSGQTDNEVRISNHTRQACICKVLLFDLLCLVSEGVLEQYEIGNLSQHGSNDRDGKSHTEIPNNTDE